MFKSLFAISLFFAGAVANAQTDQAPQIIQREDLKVVEIAFKASFDKPDCSKYSCDHVTSIPNPAIPTEVSGQIKNIIPAELSVKISGGHAFTFFGGLNGYSLIPISTNAVSDEAALQEAVKAAPTSYSILVLLPK
jgi:hypothetical protein